MNANIATVDRLVDAYNRHRIDEIIDLCSAEMSFRDHPLQLTITSLEDFRAWLEEGLVSFPDAQLFDVRHIAGASSVVLLCVERGTQSGPIPTADGEIPPSGRSMEFPFCIIFEFDAEGKITGGETYYDIQTMLSQVQPAS